jgi:hypothetical protein
VLRRADVEEPEVGELRESDDVRAIFFADGRRMGARSLVRGRWAEATFDSSREVKDGQWYQSKYRFAPIVREARIPSLRGQARAHRCSA